MHGTAKWSTVADALGGRSGKQCRERWHNHLNPDVKKGDWTVEEDRIIINMQKQLGNQWAKITKMVPGRTDNAVKNRWHSAMRSKTKVNDDAGGNGDYMGGDMTNNSGMNRKYYNHATISTSESSSSTSSSGSNSTSPSPITIERAEMSDGNDDVDMNTSIQYKENMSNINPPKIPFASPTPSHGGGGNIGMAVDYVLPSPVTDEQLKIYHERNRGMFSHEKAADNTKRILTPCNQWERQQFVQSPPLMIDHSPNGSEMRLTPLGEPQLAEWFASMEDGMFLGVNGTNEGFDFQITAPIPLRFPMQN